MKRTIALLCLLPPALAACGVVATSGEELTNLPSLWTAEVKMTEEPLLILELTADLEAGRLEVNRIDAEIQRREGWRRVESFPASCWDPDPESQLDEHRIRCWVSPDDPLNPGMYRLRVWVHPIGATVESAILTGPFEIPL